MPTAHQSRNANGRRCLKRRFIIAAAVVAFGYFCLWAIDPTRAADEKTPVAGAVEASDFGDRIAPLLAQNCLHCHNASQAEGNLNLTTRERMLAGGDSGAVIEPGNADDSYLIARIRDHEMPPEGKGKPLSDAEVSALSAWVNAGAKWPAGRTISELDYTTDRRAGRDWWSLAVVVRPPLPVRSNSSPVEAEAVGGGENNSVDRFVRAKLAERQLPPSAEADRVTLIRRA
ncbi:MAG: c-type cytochrome domain-containing protein, partial [Pirellulales bacterium]